MEKQIIRSSMPELLAEKGLKCKCRKLTLDEYKAHLSQWFFHNYKSTLTRQTGRLLSDYAEMLEVVRTWRMMYGSVKVEESAEDEIIAWYRSVITYEENLEQCRESVLTKFDELLALENEEVIVEQLQELTTALKNLIIAHGLEPYAVNNVRKKIAERFGQYVPLKIEKVSRIKVVNAEGVQSL